MNDKEKLLRHETNKLLPQTPAESEEIEVVELDDRLDMTIDPLAALTLSQVALDTNCNNKQCC